MGIGTGDGAGERAGVSAGSWELYLMMSLASRWWCSRSLPVGLCFANGLGLGLEARGEVGA
jgi:hypothetical protein